ncbi:MULTISPECIES: hypothetical protein [unclassified Gilliamella]|uniref:hypothetical protein n=1 Tax=unclassified Gilliamella TaxID=2685620 RepID=UPI0013071C05|nr:MULTISPECIES: hypothetical protein [unclassified Gilliamella]MWP48294.1 hypothetical protein [Gilliamella sp. Lep-s35]MWP68214.1 hypothetical protein [Gilliamella sp. Lep-s5]MWP76434.1 hypothetical protein [Gilliamella sp. Lep-s21]
MNSDFFNRPIWQQYLLSIFCCLTVFVVVYLIFIYDIEQQVKSNANAYRQKITETQLLQAKVNRYQTSKNSLYSLISEQELAQAIEQHHLELSTFKRYQTDQTVNWDIELNGQFFNFMNLISSLTDDFYFLDFQNLKISKQDQQLQFSFTLLFKKDNG